MLHLRKALSVRSYACFVHLAEHSGDRDRAGRPALLSEPAVLALGKEASSYARSKPAAQTWLPLARDDVRRVLLPAVVFDLAYRNLREIEEAPAAEILSGFLGLFGTSATYFTNFEAGPDGFPHSWTPITRATFDAVLGGVDDRQVGLLVVTGED